jgi:4-amino-4-deoxy-L-arabinose transferase-like glycosyltransferase
MLWPGDRLVTDRRTYVFVFMVLAAMMMLNLLSIRGKSWTYDEPVHLRYGLQVLDLDSDRFIDGTMPVSALNAAPAKLAPLFSHGVSLSPLASRDWGRKVTMLFSLLVACVVFTWARELYGNTAGLLSLALYALSPNIIAHSRLVATDVYAMGMITITLYCFWRFLKFGGLKNATLSALVLGLSQLAKYVAVFLYPVLVVVVIVRYWPSLRRLLHDRDFSGLGRRFGRAVGSALLFAAVSILVINAGFLFNRPFTPLSDYEFRSEGFRSMQASLGALSRVPVPLAYPFLEGLDRGRLREETGRGYGNMYLLGETRELGGFKGYYLFAFLFKVPIAVQILIAIAAVRYIVKRGKYRFYEDEAFLLCPVIILTIYFNLFFKLQIGVRHYLVVFPLLHVFCGSLMKDWRGLGLRVKGLVFGLLVYLVASVLSYFPHYIPYFNEIVWDRKQAYRFLADSNIDWGQGADYLTSYLAEHPDVYAKDLDRGLWFIRRYREKHMDEFLDAELPDSGLVIVSVNNLVGVQNPHRYKLLRENYEPIDHLVHAYLLFRISPEDRLRGGPAPAGEPSDETLPKSAAPGDTGG